MTPVRWRPPTGFYVAYDHRQARHDLQRYIAEHMMIADIASVPFLQAAHPHVQGYERLHGFKIQFETTWLSK